MFILNVFTLSNMQENLGNNGIIMEGKRCSKKPGRKNLFSIGLWNFKGAQEKTDYRHCGRKDLFERGLLWILTFCLL